MLIPLNVLQIILFFSLFITFLGYILRWVFPVNIEIWLGVLFLFTLYLIAKRGYQSISVPVRLWLGLMALFWSFNVLSALFHDSDIGYRTLSLISTYSTILGFASVAVAISVLKPKIDFFWYLIAAGAIAVLFAFGLELKNVGWDAFEQGHRFGGYTSQQISFGIFANTFFIILLGSFVWALNKGRLFFSFWLLLIIADFCMIIVSQSRNAWLGLPEAVIVWSVYYGFKLYNADVSFMKKLIVAISPIVVLMLLFSVQPFKKIVEQRVGLAVTGIENYVSRESFYGSVGARLMMYEAGFSGIKKHFWFGMGTENFPSFVKQETKQIALEKFEKKFGGYQFSSIHNQFLMSWLIHGVFAFILVLSFFVFMFVYFYRGLKRSPEDYKPIWVAGLVYSLATFISFLPESMLHSLYNFSHFFMVSSILIAYTSTLNRS